MAARKVRTLLACGAAVTVVAPEVHEATGELAESGAIAAIDAAPLRIELRPYRSGEAADFQLVVAATGDRSVDDEVHRDAVAAGVWVNVADDPSRCTFVLPAVTRHGDVTIAVSTGGASPALAAWLRDRVDEWIGSDVGELAALLEEARGRVRARGESTESVDWRAALDAGLPELVREGRMAEARALLDAVIEGESTRP